MRTAPIALAVAVLSTTALAAAPKTIRITTKVGKSNVQISVVLHPQVDQCGQAQVEAIRKKVVEQGEAYIRSRLPALTKKSGTDASGEKEFFGVNYLAGCPADGSAWIAFPAEGPNKSVARFTPGQGWTAMAPI